jgi:hypothetical protein
MGCAFGRFECRGACASMSSRLRACHVELPWPKQSNELNFDRENDGSWQATEYRQCDMIRLWTLLSFFNQFARAMG